MSVPDNTKDFTPFHGYIKKITSGIISKSTKKEVSDEIMCHLTDNYELALALGMNHDEAIENALSKMGDSKTLSYRLGKIHSYNPLKAMSSAITTLFFGFALSEFLFTTIFKDVFAVLSLPLIFSAVLRLRSVNKKLTAGFHLFNVFVLLYLAGVILPIGVSFPLWAKLTLTCTSFTVKGLFLLLTLSGLYKLAEPFIKDGTKKPHLKFCGSFYFLLYLFTAAILTLSEGENVTISSFVLPLLTIFCYFFTLVQLTRTRKLLWDADGEYGILQGDKKHKLTVLICVVSAIFIYAGYSYLSATKEPVKTELVIHDVSESEKQVADETRKKMLSWGVKQEHLDDLPDSEILKYKNAIYGTWCAEGTGLTPQNSNPQNTSAHTDIDYYTFVMPDEESSRHFIVRILYVLESTYTDKTPLYRQGFYRSPYNASVLNTEGYANLAPYIGIITEENGKKYKSEPFFTHKMGDGETLETPKGFEYREERGQRVYYAETFGLTKDGNATIVYCLNIRTPFFITPGFNTTASLADKLIQYGTIRSGVSDLINPFHYTLFHANDFYLYEEYGKLIFRTFDTEEVAIS